MKLRFLGTGTSTGVPALLCGCEVCRSTDPRDRRSRTSALVTTDAGASLLIDCGPDLRTQLLDAGGPAVDALLVTHHHYDHVGGADDLRPYCHHRDPRLGPLPVYGNAAAADDFRRRMPYCFADTLYPGVPTFALHTVEPGVPFTAAGTPVTPLDIVHGPARILGFRIGPLGYVTDCSQMPAATVRALRGVDTLVVNALRLRPHASHMNLSQALAVIEEIKPRRAWLTHLSHDIGLHSSLVSAGALPQGVSPAFDGLETDIPEQ